MGLSNVVDRIKRTIPLSRFVVTNGQLDNMQLDNVYAAILETVKISPLPQARGLTRGEHLLFMLPVGKWRRTALTLNLCVVEVDETSPSATQTPIGAEGRLELFFELEEIQLGPMNTGSWQAKAYIVADAVALIDQVADAIRTALGIPDPIEMR